MPYGSSDAYKKHHGKKPPSGSVGKGGGGGSSSGGGYSSVTATSHKGYGGGGGRGSSVASAVSTAATSVSTSGGGSKPGKSRAPKVPSGLKPTKVTLPKAPSLTSKYSDLTKDYTAKDKRQIKAREYKATETADLIKKHYKLDEKGRPVTKKQRVPVPKKGVSAQNIENTMARFDKKIAAVKSRLPKSKRKVAGQSLTAIALRKLYKTDKKGALLTEKKKLPVIKTSPEALQRDLQRTNTITRKMRKGTLSPKRAASLAAKEVGKSASDTKVMGKKERALLARVDELNNGPDDAFRDAVSGATRKGLQTAGVVDSTGIGDVAKGTSAALETPVGQVVTGLLGQFMRPGAASRSAIGKAMTGAYGQGLAPAGPLRITDKKTVKKINEAPGPVESFLQSNQTDPKLVWGSDIAEGIGLPKQSGIGIDLALDPLWFVGGGAARATTAPTAARLEAAVARQAPDILKAPRYSRIAKTAQRTGDMTELEGYLRRAAKARGVKLPRTRLSPKGFKDARAARESINKAKLAENTRYLKKIKDAIERAPEIQGQKYHLPGNLAAETTAAVARSQQRLHQIAPGIRINAMTPLGRELGGINIPLPKKLPLPTAGGGTGRFAPFKRELTEARETTRNLLPDAKRIDREINELDALRAAAKKAGDNKRVIALDKQIVDKTDELRDARLHAAERASAGSWLPRMETLGQRVERKNLERTIHETGRVASNLSRVMSQDSQKTLARIVAPIADDDASKLRVSLHQQALQDRGDTAFLDEFMPLNPTERQVLDDLSAFNRQVGLHGMEAGTLANTIENYATRIPYRGEVAGVDKRGKLQLGHAGDNPVRESSTSLGGSMGGEIYAARHRSAPEMASLADSKKLARAIQVAATKPITRAQAADLAERWFRSGSVRANSELLARRIQRSGPIPMSDLTPMQRQAAEWGLMQKDADAPLFSRVGEMVDESGEVSDEMLTLGPGAEDHKFQQADEAFEGLTDTEATAARIKSIDDDIDFVKQNLNSLTKGSEIAKQWRALGKQLKRERDELMQGAPHPEIPVAKKKLAAARKGVREAETRVRGLNRELKSLEKQIAAETRKGPRLQLYKKRKKLRAELETATRSLSSRKGALTRATRQHGELESATEVPEHIAGRGVTDERDYTGRLPDTRQTDLWYEMDPARANYQRTQVEALKTSMNARAMGIDSAIGRDLAEVQGRTVTVKGGKQLPTHALKRKYEKGEFVGWTAGKKFYTPDEVDFSGQLTPISYRHDSDAIDRHVEAWADEQGNEYRKPLDWDQGQPFGRAIQETIGPDRVWRTDALLQYRIDMMKQGGIEGNAYSALFDTGMEGRWQRAMQLYRYSVTTPWPAYHMRNMISDAFKSLQADPGVAMHPITNTRLMSAAMGRGKYRNGKWKFKNMPEMPTEDMLLMFDMFGVRSTQHLAEFMHLTQTGKLPRKWHRRLSPGPKGRPGKAGIEFGARREDIVRFQTFIQRLRRNGGDVADAAWYMIQHHFDYSDLTMFERQRVRNVFLFYTWYRKNIPLQLLEMVRRPYFFSSIGNTFAELAQGGTPLNQDYSEIWNKLPDMSGTAKQRALVPDYMRDALGAVTLPWNDHTATVGFGAPWNDVQMPANLVTDPFGQGLRGVFQLANPAITGAIQLGYKKDLITGRDFNDQEAVPDPLKQLFEAFDIPTGQDESGNMTVPWWASVVLRNAPFLGRGSSYLQNPRLNDASDTGATTMNRAAISYGLGLNMNMTPSQDRATDLKVKAYNDKVAELYSSLSFRNSNLTPEGKNAAQHAARDELRQWAEDHNIPRWIQIAEPDSPEYIPRRDGPEQEIGASSSGQPSLGGSSDRKLDLSSPDLPTLGGSSSSLPTLGTSSSEGSLEPNRKEGQRELRVPKGLQEEQPPSWDLQGPKSVAHAIAQAVKAPQDQSNNTFASANALLQDSPRQDLTQRQIDAFATNTERPMGEGRTMLTKGSEPPKKEKAKRPTSAQVKRIIRGLPAPSGEGFDDSSLADSIKRMAPYAVWASRETGVPASILLAVSGQESAYGTNNGPSSADARGEMQFIPGTRDYMIDKYGVDPWKDTKSAFHAGALYLKELGVQDDPMGALSSYTGGYSDQMYNNPVMQRAEAFSKLDKAAGHVKLGDSKDYSKPRPGPWQGSQSIIKELIGPKYSKKVDWKDKEDRGDPGGTLHDIGTTNAFAADLVMDEGGLDTEKLVDRISKKLGLDPSEVDYGTTGLESGIRYKGYDIEFLPYRHGTGDHVHIAAQWNGGGTNSTGSAPTGSSGGTTPTTPTSTDSGSSAGSGGYGLQPSTGRGATEPTYGLRSPRQLERDMEFEAMSPTDVAAALEERVAGTPADASYGLELPAGFEADYDPRELEAVIEALRERELSIV